MSVTLADLLAKVDNELEDWAMTGSAEVTGDGTTSAFLVAPLGSQIVQDTTFGVFIDGATTTAFTMDYASGVCVMTSTPTTAQTVSWQFTYKRNGVDVQTQAINAGVDVCFPTMYVRSNDTVATDGILSEFACPTGTEFVTGVDFHSADTDPWARQHPRRYDAFYTAGEPHLHFFSAPGQGTLRIHYVGRPVPFSSADDDLEADVGLPLRAADCIVSYACYYLLVQKMAPRIRSDVAIATQNSAALLPSQMNYGAQGYMMRFQFQLQQAKMSPWRIR